jgi:hypothetical protein
MWPKRCSVCKRRAPAWPEGWEVYGTFGGEGDEVMLCPEHLGLVDDDEVRR